MCWHQGHSLAFSKENTSTGAKDFICCLPLRYRFCTLRTFWKSLALSAKNLQLGWMSWRGLQVQLCSSALRDRRSTNISWSHMNILSNKHWMENMGSLPGFGWHISPWRKHIWCSATHAGPIMLTYSFMLYHKCVRYFSLPVTRTMPGGWSAIVWGC